MLTRLTTLLYAILSFSCILALDLSLTEGGNLLPNSYANVTWNRGLDTDPVEFALALMWPNGNFTAPRTVNGQTGMLSFHFGGAGKYVVVASVGSDPNSQELTTLPISVQPPPTESTVNTQGITTTSSSTSEAVRESTSSTNSTTIIPERHSTVLETSTIYTTSSALITQSFAHIEAPSSSTSSFPVASIDASPISLPSSTASSTPLSVTSETSSNRRSVIIGSVFGCIALVGCLAVVAFFLRRRQRRKRYQGSVAFYRDMMVCSPGLSVNQFAQSLLGKGEKDSSKFESTYSPSGAVQDAPGTLLPQKKSTPFQDAELMSRF